MTVCVVSFIGCSVEYNFALVKLKTHYMADYNSTATSTVYVNGKPAEQELKRLKNNADNLHDAIAAASKAGDKATLKKLRGELNFTNNQIKQVEGAMHAAEVVMKRLDKATPKELQSTLRQLKKELNDIERGSDAWNKQVAKIKQVKAELAQVNAELRTQESWWTRFNNKLNQMQTSLLGMIALFSGLVMAGRRAVNSYAEMEEELANTLKYTGMGREEVEKLNDAFKNLDTRTGRDKLNELAQEAGRLGKNTLEEVQGYVEAADIINVALVDLGEGATQTIAKIANIFGLDKLLGTKQAMLSVGSAVNVLSQNCTASKPYLVEFTQRMSGVGHEARMTVPELLAFGATLDANGQKVEMSASALGRLVMTLFQKPAEIAKTVGLDVQKFTETLNRSTNEGLMMFLQRLHDIGDKDALAALAPMFKDLGMDGVRMSQVLASLAAHLDMVKWEQQEANKAFKEATSATREYNIFNNTAQAGIDKARKGIHELAIQLGEKLLPLYKHIMTSGSAMLRLLNFFVDFVKNYKGLIIALTSYWVAYTVSVNASNIAFKAHYYWLVMTQGAAKMLSTTTLALKIAFYAVTGQIEKAKAAYTAFHLLTKSTPWGIIIAAVTALGVGIYNLCTRTDEFTQKTNDAIKAAKGFSAEAVKEQHELDVLFGRLKGAEKGTKDYEDAKRAIINQYGKYLSGLIDEKGNILNLEAAYNRLTIAVRRSAQERGIAAARDQLTQEYYKELSSDLTNLQSTLEDSGASAMDAAEIVSAVSAAFSSGKQIPQKYIDKLNKYSSGIEWRLLPDWIGGSQHPFWGGDSRKAAPIVNRMYKKAEKYQKGMASLDAMENGVSPLRQIDKYYLEGTIGDLKKIVKSGTAGNALVFKEGSDQGEYREVSVSEAKSLLAQYQEELAYRGGQGVNTSNLNLDVTNGTGGAAGSPGGTTTTKRTGRGGGGSTAKPDKFAAEKAWREREDALNRISYATGVIDYEKYTLRMSEIAQEFYQKQLQHKDLTENEKLSITAQYAEEAKKEEELRHKQALATQEKDFDELRASVMQDYIDNKISKSEYDMEMENIEYAHLHALVAIAEEGSDERLKAEANLRKKLLEGVEKRNKDIDDKQREHQQKLAELYKQYFTPSEDEKQALYDSTAAYLDEIYQNELAKIGDDNEKKLELEKRYLAAKKKLHDEIFAKEEKDNQERGKNWEQWTAQWLDKIFGEGTWEKYGGFITSAVSSISASWQNLTKLVEAEEQAKLAAMTKKYDAEIKAAEGNQYRVNQIQKRKEAEEKRIKDAANKRAMAMEMAQAISSNALGAINAYASAAKAPWPLGMVLGPIAAGLALSAGLIQIAAIRKQHAAQSQGYSDGGFTRPGAKDEPAGIVHAGEWVASQRLLASPVARPMIEMLDHAQRTNTIGRLGTGGSGVSPSVASPVGGTSVVFNESSELRDTIRRLNERLNEPFVTINTVTGDHGIKAAQDEYQRLMNNTLPKSKRK